MRAGNDHACQNVNLFFGEPLQAVEKASYKHRARYQHRGVLGDLSIALLVALLNLAKKHGRIFPCYGTLAHLMRKDKETVIAG
jgi:hypothetical protein